MDSMKIYYFTGVALIILGVIATIIGDNFETIALLMISGTLTFMKIDLEKIKEKLSQKSH